METQTALIVGVGPGLGAALARKCMAEGMTVIAAARHATQLDLLREADPGGLLHLRDADATSVDDVDALFDDAERHAATPDLVVFNAGTFEPGEVAGIEPDDFERCWRVGCLGGFVVGRAAARRMKPCGRGSILFTGATASLRGSARFANLAVPKFGLRALAQSLARELGPEGIHVAHVIIDGQIRSQKYDHLLDERGPDSLLEPDAIAEAYLNLHRQHRSAWTFELDLRPWSEKF